MKLIKNTYFIHIVILFLLTVVVFYPLSFNLLPMKHDAIDCFFPWRYFISSEISQGNFPYWNPYQDLGYPIHADPSSGAWYPIVWVFSLFGKYSLYTINIEYLLHVFLGGIGSYLLFKHFKFSKSIILFGSISYMFNGVFISNAQHLPYVISMCWLPYVIYFFLKIKDEINLFNPVFGGFFLYLMITGGYPAFTIILFYLFLTFVIIHSISLFKKKEWKRWITWVLRNIAFVTTTVFLSIGIFTSIYFVQPYLSRLGDFSLSQAQFSPFSIQSFISFIAPYTTSIKSDFFNSDISMRNGYFGLLPFLLFVLGILIKKPADIIIIFLFGVFCLTAAVGEVLPVREFLYHYVPMMNVFRFPSVFRAFFILSAILVALNYLQNFQSTKKIHQQLKYIFLITGLSLILAIIIARLQGYLNFKHFILNDLFLNEYGVSVWQHLVLASTIQLLFVIVFLVIIYKQKDILKWGSILLVFDFFISIQLVGSFTIYTSEISGSNIHQTFIKGERTQPLLNSLRTIKETDDEPGLGFPFWQNEAVFQKNLASEGFNSFSFTGFENLENNYPNYNNQLRQNKHLLLSNDVLMSTDLDVLEKKNEFRRSSLFFDSVEFDILREKRLKHNLSDTAFFTKISPTNFEIKTTTKEQQLLTLFQKNYVGWKAYLDNKEVTIFNASNNFMSIVLPKGEHQVIYRYENKPIKIALIVNVIGLILIFGLVIFKFFTFLSRMKNL
jgi:hypothetical protein